MTTPTGGAPMEKSMNSPDKTRTFEKGKLELTTFKNGTSIGRITLTQDGAGINVLNLL